MEEGVARVFLDRSGSVEVEDRLGGERVDVLWESRGHRGLGVDLVRAIVDSYGLHPKEDYLLRDSDGVGDAKASDEVVALARWVGEVGVVVTVSRVVKGVVPRGHLDKGEDGVGGCEGESLWGSGVGELVVLRGPLAVPVRLESL